MEERTPQQVSADSMLESVDQAISQKFDAFMGKMQGRLQELAQPRDDARIPVTPEVEPDNDVDADAMRRPAGEVDVRVATHPLYRRFEGTDYKGIRTPEADHWVKQWMQGQRQRRTDMILEAHANCERLFGRATYTVGDPATGIPDGTAGDIVPIPLLAAIMVSMDNVRKIQPLSRRFELTSTGVRIPRMGQAGGGMVLEGGTIAQGEPPIDGVLPRANKLAALVDMTDETLRDSAFNLVQMVSNSVGSFFGYEQDVQACTSDGTAPNISESIRAQAGAAADPIVNAVAGVIDFAYVTGLYFNVSQQYRTNGVWFCDAFGAEVLTNLMETGATFPILSQQSGVPGAITDDSADGFLFRKPVIEVPLVPSTGNGVILFMDPQVYGMGERSGITASVSDGPGFKTDTWSYKFTMRFDGIVLDPGTPVGETINTGKRPVVTRSGAENFA